MEGRRGIQAEVLVSLALVMVTAAALLVAVLFATHASQIARLRGLIGRALAAEVRSPTFAVDVSSSGARWWILSPGGGVHPRDHDFELAEAGRSLAAQASERRSAVLRAGAPWEPIRFAIPMDSGGRIALAELPPAVSRASILGLLVADCLVFTALGGYLLRRRVVQPLRSLAAAARALAEGESATRVPVEGVGEAAEVAWAFNEMSEALERRTHALEKAVSELRGTNRSLRQARAGLDRAERLAAVGRLAAGVAHEVGNPMAAQLAFLDLARREGSISEQASSHLGRAIEQGERVRVILRQLLDFSRPPRATRGAVDCRAVAEQAAGLVRAQQRYDGVEIAVERDGPLPNALADESMLSQILLNLIVNAADALADTPAARIIVTLRAAHGPVRAGDAPGAELGRREPDTVECEVADNGPGIAEEDCERIFDPFYTTKPPGEGTGLGLANAQRLVEELGGEIEYAPNSPRGAIFRLRLPLYEAKAQKATNVREA